MNINVENIKVLKVEHNGETIVFKSDDIVSLEYKSVSIKGRIAQIGDTAITVDCSTMYNSQIHESNTRYVYLHFTLLRFIINSNNQPISEVIIGKIAMIRL